MTVTIKTMRKLFPSDPLNHRDLHVHEFADCHKFQDSLIYYGDFDDNDLMDGLGKLEYPEKGWTIRGWQNSGELKGIGVLHHPKGVRFRGSFKSNKATGYGRYCFPDGTIHWGSFQSDQLDGIGRQKMADGTEIFGHFRKNMKNGICYAILGASRHEILVNFTDDKISGFGFYRHPDGRQYEGEFAGANFHGFGYLKLPTGELYVGNFDHGKIQGTGQWKFRNGDIYGGGFENNAMHGNGRYYKKSEKKTYEVICMHGTIANGMHKTLVRRDDIPELKFPTRPENMRTVDGSDLLSSIHELIKASADYVRLQKDIKTMKKSSKLLQKRHSKEHISSATH